MRLRGFRLLVVVVGIFVSVVACAETKNDKANWLSIQSDGYTLKYQAGDDELAKQILPEIVKQTTAANAAGALSGMALAVKKRNELLSDIAKEVGIRKPTKEMGIMFDACVKALLPIQKFLLSCRVFELDRSEDVNASTLFGYYSASKDFAVEIRDADGSEKIDLEKALSKLDAIPISLGKAGQVNDLETARKELASMKEAALLGIICHEVAEGYLVSGLKLEGAFRRWFTDGAATYIAVKVMGEVLDKESADSFVQTSFPTGSDALRDRVDLEGWRASDWDDAMPFTDAKLTIACYAYSYQEIAALVARHEADTLARICKEISSSRDKSRDAQTIANAIKKVTGEDIHQVLSKYGAKCEDKFRGIAIKDFACRSFSGGMKKFKIGGETDSITANGKDDEGVIMAFRADALKSPADFTIWIRERPNQRVARGELATSNIDKDSNQQFVAMLLLSSDVPFDLSGEFPVEIEADGKLLKETKIKVLGPTHK